MQQVQLDDGNDAATNEEEFDAYLHIPIDPVATAEAAIQHEQHPNCTLIATSYPFPDRRQLPTTIGTIPSKIWYDRAIDVPVVFVQLGDHIPRDLWLPCKPDTDALHRVMSEFAIMAVLHRDKHHDAFLAAIKTATKFMDLQRIPTTGENVLRYVAWLARDDNFDTRALREFHNYQEFYLGEYSDPQTMLERFDCNPNLFAIPRFRTNVDLTTTAPTVDGPGMAVSLYRCVYSKALLAVQAHLSAEVKLPARDVESYDLLHSDKPEMRKFTIPMFARVVWPDNRRMCGGGPLLERFNKTHGLEFARDIPVDAVAALQFASNWAGRSNDLLGIRGLRARTEELIAAATANHRALPDGAYPGTADIPSAELTPPERIGMHLQYLAHINDPEIHAWIGRFRQDENASIRLGCAKAALEVGDRQTFREIVSSEPDGRSKHYMTRLVRHRKKRDLWDQQPRLLDEQYEFPAPLWSSRTRIGPDTLTGQQRLHKLSVTGKRK